MKLYKNKQIYDIINKLQDVLERGIINDNRSWY